MWKVRLDGEEDDQLCSTKAMWEGVCLWLKERRVIDVSKDLDDGDEE